MQSALVSQPLVGRALVAGPRRAARAVVPVRANAAKQQVRKGSRQSAPGLGVDASRGPSSPGVAPWRCRTQGWTYPWTSGGDRRAGGAAPSRAGPSPARPLGWAGLPEANHPHQNALLPLLPLPPLPQVIQPVNGDPFIGMLETPVTSSPLVASYLSNLPAYRTGVSTLLRGVEIGLAHGFLLVGPFIKLGPLRNVEGVAEVAGCVNAAAVVLILTACLSIYGQATFQGSAPEVRSGVAVLWGGGGGAQTACRQARGRAGWRACRAECCWALGCDTLPSPHRHTSHRIGAGGRQDAVWPQRAARPAAVC